MSSKILEAFGRRASAPGGHWEILRIAYPLIIMNAAHTLMQFADRKFLSMNSTADVAAAAPAGILFFTLSSVFVVTVGFTSAVVAQYYGRGDRVACSRVCWGSLWFSLVAGLLCLVLIPAVGMPLIELGGHSDLITMLEQDYFATLAPCAGYICVTSAFCGFFSGRGRTWSVTIINFAACVVNILLDYLLIFGKWGFPAMGISGAGLATSIATLFGALLAMTIFFSQNQRLYPTRSIPRFELEDLSRLLRFGGPVGVQVMFKVGAFSMVIFMIGRLGSEALAATTIALSISMIAFLPLLGISEAIGIVVGQHVGRGRRNTAERAVYNTCALAFAYVTATAVLFLAFPGPLLFFFESADDSGIDFAKVAAKGRIILAWMVVCHFCDAAMFTFMGGLRGAGDTAVPMWIVIACAWGMLAPGTYLLIFVAEAGVDLVWGFISLHLVVVALLMYMRFRGGKWRSFEIIGRRARTPRTPNLLETSDIDL